MITNFKAIVLSAMFGVGASLRLICVVFVAVGLFTAWREADSIAELPSPARSVRFAEIETSQEELRSQVFEWLSLDSYSTSNLPLGCGLSGGDVSIPTLTRELLLTEKYWAVCLAAVALLFGPVVENFTSTFTRGYRPRSNAV